MAALFITGTDTGVGKTFIACGLARLLRNRGFKVGVMKPVETGCAVRNEELEPSDALQLLSASRSGQDLQSVCPYRFVDPVAPDVAARRIGHTIEPNLIKEQFQSVSESHDITLVEGAGGLLVPIWKRYTMANLVADLGIPLCIVAASRLGAISHTLLTIETAQARHLSVRAYLLNYINAHRDTATATNADLLASSTDVPCAGIVEWAPSQDDTLIDRAADTIEKSVNVDLLFGF